MLALCPVLLAAGPAAAGNAAYAQLKNAGDFHPPAVPAPSLDGAKSIYGENSMHDYYQVSDQLKKMADSTVALVNKSALVFDPAAQVYTVKSRVAISELEYVDASEDFASQSKLSGCSGSYLGKGLVMTAGHCVSDNPKDDNYAGNFFLVFGWKYDKEGFPSQYFPADAVYTVKKVEVRALEGPTGDFRSYRDFALVSMDREPADRQPLQLEKEQPPRIGQKVFTIGYPLGLAVKVNDPEQAQVYTQEKNGFLTNIDAFGGNSGGPAFDSATNKIVGILVTAVGTEFYYELNQDLAFTAQFTLPADNVQIDPKLATITFGSAVRSAGLDLFRRAGASISILDENRCRITLPKGSRIQSRDTILGWLIRLGGKDVFNRGRLMRDQQDSYGTGVMRLPDEIKNLVQP